MNGSINSYQATLALEHTFVDSSASGWWEEEAKEVLEFSSDLDLIIRTVKFIPLSDPTIAKALLSKRDETRLQGLAKSLFPGEATIDRKLSSSSIPKWNGDWLISTLVKSNIRTTAEILDCQIQWEFCKIKFSEWTAWICGIKSDNISNLLAALFDFRGTLAEHARAREDFLERLVLLEKSLPSQQPLPRWILSTAIKYDLLSEPFDALVSFFKPITEQFKEPRGQLKEPFSRISSVGKRLAIFNTLFAARIVCCVDPEWSTPFSTDFSLWERIQESPQSLAESITTSVESTFSKVSYHSLVKGDRHTKDLARKSTDFTDEVVAYLSVDKNLIGPVMHLAEHFLRLRNVFSAAAIGLALEKCRYQPEQSSWVWDTINPKDNFAGCSKYVNRVPGCLPNLFMEILAVRLEKENRADKVTAILGMITIHLIGEGEAEAERKPWYNYFWQFIPKESCVGRM